MSLQQAFPLPVGRHLPGLGPRPEGGPVAAAAAAARNAFDPQDWQACEAYLYGFELLADGCFWEAHEVWEPVWMHCLPNSRERAVVQGLIQCANAALKSAMGRPGAARRLLGLATGLLEDVAGPGPVLGVDVARAAAALRALQSGEDADRRIADCQDLQPICNIMQMP